jgi:D-arabinose 1-dehydrogenase-like Zn-dependent alcohol dehydrogenase
MQAMVLNEIGAALEWTELPDRNPGPGEIRVKVGACGVCRTDLHLVDGELPNPMLPIIPGHEIVGRVEAIGAGVAGLNIGEHVGVPWLGHTCGVCPYCLEQRENLCDRPLFTGFTRDGGFATATIVDARFPYDLLWQERQLASVANLTRQDGVEFLRLAPQIGIVKQTTTYPLKQANQALADLRAGRFVGAAVLVP